MIAFICGKAGKMIRNKSNMIEELKNEGFEVNSLSCRAYYCLLVNKEKEESYAKTMARILSEKRVKNFGKVTRKEVSTIYYSSPYPVYLRVLKEAQEMKDRLKKYQDSIKFLNEEL